MKAILVGAALVAFSAGAYAQDKRPDYGPDVNAVGAKKIAAGVLAECQKNGWNVAVAVVEDAAIVPVTWLCGMTPPPGKMTAKGANHTDIPVGLLPLRCR